MTLRERIEGLVEKWRPEGWHEYVTDGASRDPGCRICGGNYEDKAHNIDRVKCADELAAALAAEGPEPRELKVMDGTDWKYDYVRDEAWIDGRLFVPVLTQADRRTGPAAAPSLHKEGGESWPGIQCLNFASPEDAKRAEKLFNDMTDEIERLRPAALHKDGLRCPICGKALSHGISWCKTCDVTHAVRCVECHPCGYINTGPCELAPLHKEGAGGESLKSVLAEHWLAGIHCHHAVSPDDSTYDWATCACSKVNLPHRGTVGEAVGTWIEHVLDELAAASPAGSQTHNPVTSSEGPGPFSVPGPAGRAEQVSGATSAAKDGDAT